MDEFWKQIHEDWPNIGEVSIVVYRLVAALVLAAFLGINRERKHESAGLRTHLLVCMSAALFVILVGHQGNTSPDDVSRVVQGIAAGIGFVGGGAILKLEKDNRAHGLTTATSIWLAAAIGVGCGTGRVWKSLIAALLGWFVLAVVSRLERHTVVTEPPLVKP